MVKQTPAKLELNDVLNNQQDIGSEHRGCSAHNGQKAKAKSEEKKAKAEDKPKTSRKKKE